MLFSYEVANCSIETKLQDIFRFNFCFWNVGDLQCSNSKNKISIWKHHQHKDMTKDNEVTEMLHHLSSLNLNKEEIQRLATVLKDDEFKKIFNDYIQEISDPENKEAMERHINMCEKNPKHGSENFSLANKELLLPYADFCIKTYDTKTTQKVFINICYCEKIGNCEPFANPIRHGTEWKIPYSLGGPAKEKDKAQKKCLVYDYIVGMETHKNAKDDKKFKQFLISTAIEAIEKMKDVQLDRKFSLPLIKYKGKNGSKEPRIFTINKEVSSKDLQNSSNANNRTNKDVKKVEKKVVVPPPIDDQLCTLDVEKDKESSCSAVWETEIEPPYEVLYSNAMDYTTCWNDSQLHKSKITPEAIVLRINMVDIINSHDILLDVEEKQIMMRAPGKYRLKVDLKYRVNKLQSHAQWKKNVHQLVITLPVESTITTY